jgi:hypothetical protein
MNQGIGVSARCGPRTDADVPQRLEALLRTRISFRWKSSDCRLLGGALEIGLSTKGERRESANR